MTKVAAGPTDPQSKGAYFGQTPPGEVPVSYAPDVLNSVSVWVEATDFSPDGKINEGVLPGPAGRDYKGNHAPAVTRSFIQNVPPREPDSK